MQLHQVRSTISPKREKRVGRGGKRGTTSGRGTKGQRARAGAKVRPALRDIIKKLPKLRGYRFRSFRTRPTILDIATVAERFPSGATVDAAALLKQNLIRTMKGRVPPIKILGSANLAKHFTFRGMRFSASARASVEKAGGTIHGSAKFKTQNAK